MIGFRFHTHGLIQAGALAAAALCGSLWAQAPAYTATGIVNASDYSAGPFAPSSMLSLFGTNLAWITEGVSAGDMAAGQLPTDLAAVSVFVDNVKAPLLYVSPTQINFLMSANQIPGDVTVVVEREGAVGPAVTITLVDAAPALFVAEGGFVVAQDWNAGYAPITASVPAEAGDVVVLYATGLGYTAPAWASGEVAQCASNITALASLQLLLNGTAIDSSLVLYAGSTPGYSGLYQINFKLPANTSTNPEIRVRMGAQISIASIKLAVQ